MQDPKAFNDALASISPIFKLYSETKQKGWETFTSDSQKRKQAISTAETTMVTSITTNNTQYSRPKVTLGYSTEYATHYEKYLLPRLHHNENQEIKSSPKTRYFLDFGAAPGGCCRALLEREKQNNSQLSPSGWKGVAVTLGPNDGGLKMDDDMLKCAIIEGGSEQQTSTTTDSVIDHFSSRLVVKYRDVCDSESFIGACNAPSQFLSSSSSSDKNNDQEHWADFVNCGIVLDAIVKSKKTGKVIGYGEQLYIQLIAAMRALKNGTNENRERGDLMIALRLDYPSLPETIPTIDLFVRNSNNGCYILPTMYTKTAGRKQLYLLARGVLLSEEICNEVRTIWEKGRERYVKLRAALIEARVKKESGERRDRVAETKNDDSVEEEEEEETRKGLAQVQQIVKRVYQAVGSTLDEFCGMVKDFLEKNWEAQQQ